MNFHPIKRFWVLSLLLFCILVLSGCGDQPTADSSEPPVISPPHALVPKASGKKLLGGSDFSIDCSNQEKGYLVVQSDSSFSRANVSLSDEEGTTYSYFIDPGETAIIPISSGPGSYTLSAYENIGADQYAALFCEILEIDLENEFLPFLYPNQYVNFSDENKCVQLAISFYEDGKSDLDLLTEVYEYVTTHVTYDNEKAATVAAGYLPDVDETLETGTGICFDYAALSAAMLRTLGIPCKLQIGYSNTIKHAWIDVYIRGQGWVNKAIAFDGNTWGRMDPTYAAGETDDSIMEYIGDGANYTVQFTR